MANVHWLKKINKGTSWPQFRQLWVAGMGDRCLRSSSQNGKTDSCFQSGGQERERKVVWGAKFKNDWPGQGEKHAWLTIADSCGKTEQASAEMWVMCGLLLREVPLLWAGTRKKKEGQTMVCWSPCYVHLALQPTRLRSTGMRTWGFWALHLTTSSIPGPVWSTFPSTHTQSGWASLRNGGKSIMSGDRDTWTWNS